MRRNRSGYPWKPQSRAGADEVRALVTRFVAYAREQVDDAATTTQLGAVIRQLFDGVQLGVIEGVPDVRASLRVLDNPPETLVNVQP